MFCIELFLLLPSTLREEKNAKVFAEETFAKFIFAIYILHPIYSLNLFRKNKENATSYKKLYNFQYKYIKA